MPPKFDPLTVLKFFSRLNFHDLEMWMMRAAIFVIFTATLIKIVINHW